ncbi:MAG: BatA and WFA domain-containing protein [Marinilabiliales bacterium]
MSFLYPGFLWALFALSIPVIIHLFNFRKYKTVYFSNIKLLKSVEQETRSRSRLKQLLILLARLLLITSLVFAFAQPVIVNNKKVIKKDKAVSIYIDNSFSMDAEGQNGKLIEFAKSKIPDIINAYEPDKKFILITNDNEIKHQFVISREQLLDYVAQVSASPQIVKLSDIFLREKEIKNNENITYSDFFIFTDFQKYFSDFDNIKIDTNTNYNLIPLYPQTNKNLYIDSIWFERPIHSLGQMEKVYMLIKNSSDEDYNDIPVKLYINDSLKSMGNFSIKENSEITISLSYKNSFTGISNGRIEIIDYPIVYDNDFYYSYYINDKLNVLIINPDNQENKYLNALLKNDSIINFSNVSKDRINISETHLYQTIILSEIDSLSSGIIDAIKKYVQEGGSVVYIPSSKFNVNSFNNIVGNIANVRCNKTDTAKKIMSFYNNEHYIYKNVFIKLDENAEYPYINKSFILTGYMPVNTVSLLKDRKGNSFFYHNVIGRGNLYYFTFPFDEKFTDFMGHPLFVPSLINIVINSGTPGKEYYFLSQQQNISIDAKLSKECNLTISNRDSFIIYPDYRFDGNKLNINIRDLIKYAGNYTIKCKNNIIGTASFNYARKESNMDYYSAEEIKSLFTNNYNNITILNAEDKYFTKIITKSNEGIPLWKYFLIAALIFIIIEVLIIRLIK